MVTVGRTSAAGRTRIGWLRVGGRPRSAVGPPGPGLSAAVKATRPAQAGATPGARSVAVSWAEVGAGWSLAEYSASTSGGVTPRKAGATLVYLVGPNGYRDALYEWLAGQTAWALIDWSGDKTRALQASTSLLWFNPATSTTQMLMRAPAGLQGVVADVPYDHGG